MSIKRQRPRRNSPGLEYKHNGIWLAIISQLQCTCFFNTCTFVCLTAHGHTIISISCYDRQHELSALKLLMPSAVSRRLTFTCDHDFKLCSSKLTHNPQMLSRKLLARIFLITAFVRSSLLMFLRHFGRAAWLLEKYNCDFSDKKLQMWFKIPGLLCLFEGFDFCDYI